MAHSKKNGTDTDSHSYDVLILISDSRVIFIPSSQIRNIFYFAMIISDLFQNLTSKSRNPINSQ